MLRCQLLTSQRMLIVTEPEEHITGDNTTGSQSQPFSPDTQPLTILRFILRVIIIVGKMLVKVRLRTRTILLWYAAKHTSIVCSKIIQPIGMNSLQPDIPVCDRIPVIMVETVAPSSERIAPHGAQSGIPLMLRFGRNKMLELIEHTSGMKGRFLAMETEIYAMTLTPPRGSGRAAGSRLAWLLVAKLAGKTNDEPVKGANTHYEQTH